MGGSSIRPKGTRTTALQVLRSAENKLPVAYNQPENVRELENKTQRALAPAEPGSPITSKLHSD